MYIKSKATNPSRCKKSTETPWISGGGGAKQNGKMSLNPIVKQTGQESGGELCEFFKFWSFLKSKSVNNMCTRLRHLGDFVNNKSNKSKSGRRSPQSRPLTGNSLGTPLGDFSPQTHWATAPKRKFLPSPLFQILVYIYGVSFAPTLSLRYTHTK